MKKTNEPIDTLCRRVLRKSPEEIDRWLAIHPDAVGHAKVVERVELLREAGAIAIHVGEAEELDDGRHRLNHLILTLPETHKRVDRVLAAIRKTQSPKAQEPDIGRHFVAVYGLPIE